MRALAYESVVNVGGCVILKRAGMGTYVVAGRMIYPWTENRPGHNTWSDHMENRWWTYQQAGDVIFTRTTDKLSRQTNLIGQRVLSGGIPADATHVLIVVCPGLYAHATFEEGVSIKMAEDHSVADIIYAAYRHDKIAHSISASSTLVDYLVWMRTAPYNPFLTLENTQGFEHVPAVYCSEFAVQALRQIDQTMFADLPPNKFLPNILLYRMSASGSSWINVTNEYRNRGVDNQIRDRLCAEHGLDQESSAREMRTMTLWRLDIIDTLMLQERATEILNLGNDFFSLFVNELASSYMQMPVDRIPLGRRSLFQQIEGVIDFVLLKSGRMSSYEEWNWIARTLTKYRKMDYVTIVTYSSITLYKMHELMLSWLNLFGWLLVVYFDLLNSSQEAGALYDLIRSKNPDVISYVKSQGAKVRVYMGRSRDDMGAVARIKQKREKLVALEWLPKDRDFLLELIDRNITIWDALLQNKREILDVISRLEETSNGTGVSDLGQQSVLSK